MSTNIICPILKVVTLSRIREVTWSDARDPGSATSLTDPGASCQSLFSGLYTNHRTAMVFDSSAVPVGPIIVGAQIKGAGYHLFAAGYLAAVPYTGSLTPGLTDYGSVGTTLYGSVVLISGSPSPFTITLSPGALADIVAGGSTKFGLRNKDDRENITPGSPGEVEDVDGTGEATELWVQYVPLIISSVTPNTGFKGQVLTVVLAGQNLSTVTALDFGADITVDGFTVDSDIQITAQIRIASGAALGARDVSATNTYGTDMLAGGFTVVAPSVPPIITSITPNSGQQGDTITGIVIHGYNFTGVDTMGYVDLGQGITPLVIVVDNDTQITIDIEIALQAVAGFRDLLVQNALAASVLPGAFQVLPATGAIPTVTSATPDSGAQGTGPTSVVIAGTNFTGATDVIFSDPFISVGSFVVDSDIQITADVTIDLACPAGLKKASVTNAIGTGTG